MRTESPTEKIVFVTCCENGFFCLRKLHAAGREIAAVVTVSPQVATKHNISGYVDVTAWCVENGVRVVVLETYSFALQHLAGIEYNLIVVNGWNRLLAQSIIDSAPFGAIGLHAGHPPIGHGRSPLVWNIIYGHPDIDVYAFGLTAAADDGPILGLRTVEITAHDDVGSLYEKVMWAGSAAIEEAIRRRMENRPGLSQSVPDSKVYAKRTPEDGDIDFHRSVERVHDFIRAQSAPYPGAFTHLNGQRWRIDRAMPFDRFAFRDRARVPGLIVDILPSGLIVMTGTSPIWITDVSIEGKSVRRGAWHGREALIGARFVRSPQFARPS